MPFYLPFEPRPISLFYYCKMGGDGKLRSSVVGRDADGRSDGTRTGLMNGVRRYFKNTFVTWMIMWAQNEKSDPV